MTRFSLGHSNDSASAKHCDRPILSPPSMLITKAGQLSTCCVVAARDRSSRRRLFGLSNAMITIAIRAIHHLSSPFQLTRFAGDELRELRKLRKESAGPFVFLGSQSTKRGRKPAVDVNPAFVPLQV